MEESSPTTGNSTHNKRRGKRWLSSRGAHLSLVKENQTGWVQNGDLIPPRSLWGVCYGWSRFWELKGPCPMPSSHVMYYGRTGKCTSRAKHERLCQTAHDHLVQLHFVCISSKWLRNTLGIVVPVPVLRTFWQQTRETFGAKDLKNSGPDFELQRFEVILCWKFGLDTSLVAARIRQNLQSFGSIPSVRNYQFPYFCCSWCFWHPGTNCLHLNEMRKVSPANYAISFPHYVFLHLLAALLQNQQQTVE